MNIPSSNRLKNKFSARPGIVLLVFLAGCSLSVKNIKPENPYNFALLDQMAKYAQAAYADDATIRAACQPLFNDVYIQTIPSTNNKYFLATSTVTHTQLIAIAGTANIENVLLDADLTQEMVPELKISLHRGFARAAHLIYADVKPHLIAGYHLQITGHSLGGAEALILGMTLKAAGTPADGLVTFGQPKVSNQAGVDAFQDLPLTRVVNQNDVVPELPLNPFRHIGGELVLFPGQTYSVVNQRPFDPAQLVAAWQALQKHQSPTELPQHYIANYLANMDSKLAASQDIPYPKS
jgi:triacylglycerol lipase